MIKDSDLIYSGQNFNPAGKFGLSLNGGMATSPILPYCSEFTIDVWIKIQNPGMIQVALSANSDINIGINSNGNAYAAYPGAAFLTSAFIGDGAWHLLSLQVGATGGDFYVDGINTNLSRVEIYTLNSLIAIRYPIGLPQYNWTGEVDEVSVYNVKKYSANFTPQTAPTPDNEINLVAIFHLDGNTEPGLTILPNDVNIIYSPYNWKIDATMAKTINSGAYFRCLFSGISPILIFDTAGTTAPIPQIWYRVDGYDPFIKSDVQNTVAVTMPISTILWHKHTLEVIVKSTSYESDRWNTQDASVKFTGLSFTSGGVSYPIERLNKNILLFGDSITEGLRAVSISDGTSNDASDAKLSYAFELGKLLGCEFGIVGFGAQGWTVSGQGNVPSLPNAYNNLWLNEPRDFSINPDIVIINMGQNDDATNTVSYIVSVLNSLISVLSANTKIVMLRPFSGIQAENIQAAILACSNPSQVIYFNTAGFFDSFDSSDGAHPYGYTATMNIAPKIANGLVLNPNLADVFLWYQIL